MHSFLSHLKEADPKPFMSTTIRHISNFFDRWAPNETKLEYDNTGLLIGDAGQKITTVLTCLDVTLPVVQEASDCGAQLIVAHHPLIFKPLKRITEQDSTGKIARELIRKNISLFVSHTNLDAAKKGVSFELANRLGLKHTGFLKLSQDSLRLVLLRLPGSLKDQAKEFLSSYTGDIGWSEEENNVAVARFQFDSIRLADLRSGLVKLFDGSPFTLTEIPAEGKSPEYGFGVIGKLESPMSREAFLDHVSEALDARAVRYSGSRETISTVAVCGGAGSFLSGKAAAEKADAYVTGDIKYHEYFSDSDMLIVDAGHYETEAPIIAKMAAELRRAFPELRVEETRCNTNPMKAHYSGNFIKQQ